MSHGISIDNGRNFVDPEIAIEDMGMDTITAFMDYDLLEKAIHDAKEMTDLAILKEYLKLSKEDLVIG